MLKQQQGYVLSKIGPHTYLLPYGQSIADQKHGIIINETGEFLWKMLETPQSMVIIFSYSSSVFGYL